MHNPFDQLAVAHLRVTRRRRDIIARPEIARRAEDREEGVHLGPGIVLCETSAHTSISSTTRSGGLAPNPRLFRVLLVIVLPANLHAFSYRIDADRGHPIIRPNRDDREWIMGADAVEGPARFKPSKMDKAI